MKFVIAFTLFVVVSALPRPHAVDVEDETPPIVFRHWEPTPDLRRPHLPNKGFGDLDFIKELISELANSTELSKDPKDILNALQIIKEILNHNGGNNEDNEAGLPIIGGPDVGSEDDSSINDETDDGSEADSSSNDEPDDENDDDDDDDADSPVNGGADVGQEVENHPENELVYSRRLVDFMPRPVPLVPHPIPPEGIAFLESPVGGIDESDQI